MSAKPQTTAAALIVALTISGTAALAGDCAGDVSDYSSRFSQDIENLANKSPDEVRECMLQYWRNTKASAESGIKWYQDILKRAEEGIRQWSSLPQLPKPPCDAAKKSAMNTLGQCQD